MNKFIVKYIKSKIPIAVVFLACFLINFVIAVLYKQSIESALYAFLLCLFLIVPFGAYKCFVAYKKFEKLEAIVSGNEIILQKDSLQESTNIIETEYQKLLERFQSEKQSIASDFDSKRQDMEDYYTLWAHQIKTPIFAMRLLLQSSENELSRECGPELFKIEQYVEMVLGYLRLESDSSDFVIKNCSIDNIIKTAVKKFSRQFIIKKLSFKYSETDVSAVTDEKWLGFVIEQIISNALKYTQKGEISIFNIGDIICIKDTGIGIAPEDLPRVFEKGYTGYNGRTDKKSTGLGLYLCRRITEKLGHKLTIESVVAKGTIVKINLSRPQLNIE